MKVEVGALEQTGSSNLVKIKGRIDTTNYQELMNELNGISFPEGEEVVLDFRDVEYISSAGLRTILVVGRNIGLERFKIINVSDEVYDIFDTTGFTSIFEMERMGEEQSTYLTVSFKDLLLMKAKRDGDQIFLYDGEEHYTWSEINACAQVIAMDLSRLGVRKGSHVGICSTNSVNWILTFFATQMLGAFACLLNFNYNSQEIKSVAKVGDITHLCFGEIHAMKDKESFLKEITGEDSCIESTYDISRIRFKERMDEIKDMSALFDGKVEFDAPCVMIYTSGSTGTPKGVLLSAYNILNASATMADVIHIDEGDKLCLILPLFHIFGMTAGFFSNAINGGSIYIPENIRTGTLLTAIAEEKCTLFHSVPTMILALMHNKDFDREKVETLRCIIMAGAPATEAQIGLMREKFEKTHFICAYGLSEMAPVSITDYDDSIEHVTKTVGKPVPFIHMEIINTETGKPCAAGEVGEVIVEGYNLMVCYYKAEMELQSIDERGFLHTGDLGYLDEEGYLHLTGRAKELIIRGGENIMPNEVAEAISAHDGIADVKVVGVPDDFFGESVCACICMKDGFVFDEEEMRAFLESRLAKYKIPALFILYDELPSLSNGKVDMVGLRRDAIAKAGGGGRQ